MIVFYLDLRKSLLQRNARLNPWQATVLLTHQFTSWREATYLTVFFETLTRRVLVNGSLLAFVTGGRMCNPCLWHDFGIKSAELRFGRLHDLETVLADLDLRGT